jgi:hypothetical protein
VVKANKRPFKVRDFLSRMDGGRTLEKYQKNQNVFRQGDRASSGPRLTPGAGATPAASKRRRPLKLGIMLAVGERSKNR